jgi:hypothetical protein
MYFSTLISSGQYCLKSDRRLLRLIKKEVTLLNQTQVLVRKTRTSHSESRVEAEEVMIIRGRIKGFSGEMA